MARACRSLDIAPIGVASKADLGASWLEAMDTVVCVGPASARDSYLRGDRLVQAALQTGAAAVHPGWGFLSEDPRFAALCEQHGVTFVGPSPALLAKMGVKSPAKAAMKAAGLPVVPGSDGALKDLDDALRCAADAGYPVLLKADRGGGGRGMRLCANEDEVREAFPQARAEALSAFGSGAVYLEKFLSGGRHVEVQILADRFGRALHLGERDCSVQRKHQKLVEESPCPVLDADERTQLGLSAAAASARLGYVGAGTIEFLRSADGALYFMEMNTRLQVEHPVSEMVTGVDIVAEQIRVAAGQPLAFEQSDVRFDGHAIEVRLNAEDPSDGFRPSPGRLERFRIPSDCGPGTVRVETHLTEGESVSPFYDSLIAKVIAHGPDRAGAIETMARTLAQSSIEGVKTTAPMHRAILASADFAAHKYDTQTIPGWPA